MNGDGCVDYEEFLAATINRSKLEREELLKQVRPGAPNNLLTLVTNGVLGVVDATMWEKPRWGVDKRDRRKGDRKPSRANALPQ